jgi:NADH:ubiquinone reductase (H+-translocating)
VNLSRSRTHESYAGDSGKPVFWGELKQQSQSHFDRSTLMKRVVIVGGGFAGIGCGRKLASNPDVHITLIDKNNYQQFQPLLYQVATALLGPGNAAFSLRSLLRGHPNVDVKMAEVVSADLTTRTVETADGKTYQGDFLILAAGAQVNFFGTAGAAEYAYPLYSLHDAELLRSRILMLLESVDKDPSLIKQGALNFVVVGAGPTGVETAGSLGHLIQTARKDLYNSLEWTKAQVFLVDHGHTVLNGFSKKSQEYATRKLERHGVQIRFGIAVKEVHSGHVVLSDGTTILTHTAVWAGGLKASSLSNSLGIKTGHGGRIDVRPDFSVAGFSGVYALGDFANIADTDGKPLPQLASVAQQAGHSCAKNIVAAIQGRPGKPFRYVDKGIMAMIGRNAAVAEVGKKRHELTGPLAFAAWLAVHALLLIPTRAKIEAFLDWAWDYFGGSNVDPVLDRPEQVAVNWHEDTEEELLQAKS